jgi:hypothetical protein
LSFHPPQEQHSPPSSRSSQQICESQLSQSTPTALHAPIAKLDHPHVRDEEQEVKSSCCKLPRHWNYCLSRRWLIHPLFDFLFAKNFHGIFLSNLKSILYNNIASCFRRPDLLPKYTIIKELYYNTGYQFSFSS